MPSPNPNPNQKNYVLTQQLLDKINKAWLWMRNLKIVGDGTTFTNSETNPSISVIQKPPRGFSSSAPPFKTLKPHTNPHNGIYVCNELTAIPDTDIDLTSDLDLTTPFTVGSDDIYLINWQEYNLDTAIKLELGLPYCNCSLFKTNDDGTEIYQINGVSVDDCPIP